ncbi:hypothetical protein O0L34_g9969 [Tuta absoluta]|nr:hypothetical protein O0L34_g9969 [Tuta absoluta]
MSEGSSDERSAIVDSDDGNDDSGNLPKMKDNVEQKEIIMEVENSTVKESNQDDGHNLEWREVTRAKKRKTDNCNISISCLEQLPKQFALAKLFTQLAITNILRVKYVNAYKAIITFENEESAEKLISSQDLIQKGWRIQKSWEVGISYGIIRDIDLNLNEKEILECIRSSNQAEVLSAKRLNRRKSDYTGWTESETIRLGFKGGSLPRYIYIMNMRVQVEPFVFPVTQCARCWRFGHTLKMCPSTKVICPKCTKKHPNCETTTFKCVNCAGAHMALVKTCPAYLKERRIREIMSEFNCTFRKASMMYVPPDFPAREENDFPAREKNIPEEKEYTSSPIFHVPRQTVDVNPKISSYASRTASNPTKTNQLSSSEEVELPKVKVSTKSKERKKSKKRRQHFSSDQSICDWEVSSQSSSDSGEDGHVLADVIVHNEAQGGGGGGGGGVKRGERRDKRSGSQITSAHTSANAGARAQRPPTADSSKQKSYETGNAQGREQLSFKVLMLKLKVIFLSDRLDWSEKFKACFKQVADWVWLVIIENFSDVPIFKMLFSWLGCFDDV